MMTFGQKALALAVLVLLNLAVLVVGVGFAGIFGLFMSIVFFTLSGAAAWRVMSL